MKLKRVRLFGSHATGKNRPDSDVDLLVEFDGTPTLFDLCGVKFDFEEKLGKSVDVVMSDHLFPILRERILNEAIDV